MPCMVNDWFHPIKNITGPVRRGTRYRQAGRFSHDPVAMPQSALRTCLICQRSDFQSSGNHLKSPERPNLLSVTPVQWKTVEWRGATFIWAETIILHESYFFLWFLYHFDYFDPIGDTLAGIVTLFLKSHPARLQEKQQNMSGTCTGRIDLGRPICGIIFIKCNRVSKSRHRAATTQFLLLMQTLRDDCPGLQIEYFSKVDHAKQIAMSRPHVPSR